MNFIVTLTNWMKIRNLHASLEIQEVKLKRFQMTFGLSKLYYSVEQAPYLLFLSADDPTYLSKLSDEHCLV